MSNTKQTRLINSLKDYDSHPHWSPNDTNFTKNMQLPIHRWFRFPAGFSADWVKNIIKWHQEQVNPKDMDSYSVLDPFAGSGTSVLAAESIGVKSFGIEAHPFLSKIGKIKLMWDTNPQKFYAFSMKVLESAKNEHWPLLEYTELITRMYHHDVLVHLNSLRSAWEKYNDDSPESKLTWLAITSILRCTSHAGTAPWQYVLPNKQKKNQTPPYLAFECQIIMMVEDITQFSKQAKKSGTIYEADSRYTNKIPDKSISLIVTSPPYANNFDYADATRLEMTFWGEISGWKDLKNLVRQNLVRSCSQHVSSQQSEMNNYLSTLEKTPISEEIQDVCNQLSEERLNHGGKKQYHVMIPAYFSDLFLVWKNLRKMSNDDVLAAFVIGDSAPYGVYVPVDKWLGELAVYAGFEEYSFEKIKERNVKWKMENRKHTVPLKEGVLWVR